jgi:hypothetical protein
MTTFSPLVPQETLESAEVSYVNHAPLVHPMKKSKHDHVEHPLPSNFVQRFSLNYNHQPEVRDPFFEKLSKTFSKNTFTVKSAIDTIATDEKFSGVNPEEIERSFYTLMKFGHITEV